MNDSRIVDLYLARDEDAIRATEAEYGAKLGRIAAGILGDVQAAEECVNSAYLRAWNSIPPNEPREYLFPYLAKLTRQIALNLIKTASAVKRTALLTELTQEMSECMPSRIGVEDEAEARELMRLVNTFLSRLPEEKRSIFLRRYWYFDPIADIAKSFGCREGRVRTLLYRIREQLKTFLEAEGYKI